jgi:HPt (histidine-containing phosphotransfer) domain-containing protein
MGDAELAATVLAGFLEDMPRQMAQLKESVKEKNAGKAGSLAHKIKGASGNMGAYALQETAYAMEKAGKGGNVPELERLMPELEKRFDAFRTAVEEDRPEI